MIGDCDELPTVVDCTVHSVPLAELGSYHFFVHFFPGFGLLGKKEA